MSLTTKIEKQNVLHLHAFTEKRFLVSPIRGLRATFSTPL